MVVPLLYIEWLTAWCAYFLSRWALLEVLEYAGRLSILFGVIFYFAESGERTQARHYQAWQVINTAQGRGGNGGRIEALSQLNDDLIPLVGVDVSDAFLQGVRLNGANLRRAVLSGADMRSAGLAGANLIDADMVWTNLENADLRHADLAGARMDNADLTGADLAGIMNWRQIRSLSGAELANIRNAPDGFAAWAAKQVAQPSATTQQSPASK